MSIISRLKAACLRAGTHSRSETVTRAASRRNYRRLAKRVSLDTTLTEISDLATSAGLNPAALTLAAVRNLKVAS
jgi:hypothetical protein